MNDNVHRHRATEEKLLQNERTLAEIEKVHVEASKTLQIQISKADKASVEIEAQAKKTQEELKATISLLIQEKVAAKELASAEAKKK